MKISREIHTILFALAGWAALPPAFSADLYKAESFRSLVGDVRAHQVGDNLTVLVVENSTATSSADTNTKRASDASLSAGYDIKGTKHSAAVDLGVGNDFSGVARTQRAGKLLAQLTVTVKSVDPNGDLRVAGEQQLEVNNELQKIFLEGKVRPQDIGDNNSIVSSRIAEARISYIGDGVLADGQRPGWLSRVMNWLGL